MDVSMNAHGAVVETMRGRPCMSSMHGAFSVGALAGAGVGAVMLSMGFAPWEHTLASSLTVTLLAIVTFAFLLPARVDSGHGPRGKARLNRTILVLGVLGLIAMMAEGAMIDWSAIYMREVVGVEVAREGWAFAGFSAAMAVIRIAGDRLSLHLGRTALMRISAAIAIAGLALMAAVPHLVAGVAGATLVGVGVANCVPLVFVAAAKVGGAGAAGGGIALVAGLSYCGFLLGPPIVGGVSELFSLRWALAGIGALLLVLIVTRLPDGNEQP
jgi:predicted MFS family arabinose efflux permease